MLPLPVITGRGLIYLTAAALFVGAGAMEFYRRHHSTRERARFGLLLDDVELFTDALATSLRLPEACRSIIGETKITPGATSPIELDYKFDPDQNGRLATGAEAWAGTRLGRLDLGVPNAPDQRTRIDGRDLRRFRARFDLSFVIPDRFKTGVDRSLEVFLWVDQDDVVRQCFGPSSIGALCNMTGGYYADQTVHPRCRSSLRAVIESKDGPLARGSCRVTKVARRTTDCPAGAGLMTQQKMGYRTSDVVICRDCD